MLAKKDSKMKECLIIFQRKINVYTRILSGDSRIRQEAATGEIHAKIGYNLHFVIFETKIKEITKIMRVRNEDGLVSEEKKDI